MPDESLCGCGRPGRYMHFDSERKEVWACNKYQRCLTYDEQFELIKELRADMVRYRNALEKIVEINAMDYEYKAWAKKALDANA